VSGSSVELIEDGRAALRAGDADAARAAFERALAEVATGDALEGLARAAYLQLDYPASIEQWERAYAAHRRGGDNAAAARVARTLGYTYGSLVGDMAVHSGWMARSQRLLAEAPDDREAGWVTLNRGMFEPDPPTKERLLREAIAIAQRVGAVDLEFVTLAYLGANLVHTDRVDEGWLCSTRLSLQSRAMTSMTSSFSRRSSASSSRPASTRTTSPAPSSGSGSAKPSPSDATSPRCRRSAARTTAAS
jgi:tetratricopeptide (TPR) repeat protein